MKQVVLGFGLLIFALLSLFQLAKYQYFKSGFQVEIWIAVFSVLFFIIGIFLSRRLFRPKPQIIEKEIFQPANESAPDLSQLSRLGISKREYEILQLINEGLSNQQIAQKLFVSENTVKKHISHLIFLGKIGWKEGKLFYTKV